MQEYSMSSLVLIPDSRLVECTCSPVVDTDELATTFLDEHQLAKNGLYVEHKERPDYRKPVCVCVCV